jgi:soluble lytic murein transglycosylase-like protein
LCACQILAQTDYDSYARNVLKIDFQRYKEYSKELSPVINEASCMHGIPVEMIESVITCESGWRQYARSKENCKGYMQVLNGSYDVRANIVSGTGILKHYIDKCKGDTLMGLTAYNRGYAGAKRYYKKYGHCSNYAKRVMKIYRFYQKYKKENE